MKSERVVVIALAASVVAATAVAAAILFQMQNTNRSVWISPNGHSDDSDCWVNEGNAYDQDLNTYAQSYVGVRSWSGFLLFSLNQTVQSNNLRVWVDRTGEVDVDVLMSGTWTDVFQGRIEGGRWVEMAFPKGDVDEVRLRFHNADIVPFTQARIIEVEIFWL